MAKKATVLLVISESLNDNVIVSQALDHARVIAKAGLAEFEIIAVAVMDAKFTEEEKFKDRAEEIADAPVHVIRGTRARIPLSPFVNGRRIAAALGDVKKTFTHVHARNDYSAIASRYVARATGATLIWDCRGDAVSEVDFFRATSRLAWPAKQGLIARRRVAARVADRAIFVSHALRKRIGDNWRSDKPYEIIPCSASHESFFYSAALRQDARKELNLAPRDRLYIYSGGLAPYQKFPEMIQMFDRISKNDRNAWLLVLTPAKAQAAHLIGKRPRVTLKSVATGDVNRYLNAADAAIMLRDKVPTNIVSSPTKFAEYCLVGLPVVMTDAVADSYALASQMGNVIDVTEANTIPPFPKFERDDLAKRYTPILSREALVGSYERIYAPSIR
ncbi:MAG: hypothetical protein IH899_04345 [Planctomycetes bacterium]|nr:hypothetical protein [Planctomycetota bacterium]